MSTGLGVSGLVCVTRAWDKKGELMTAQHTLVPKHVAIDWAFARFLVVSGSGRGKRFYDPATQRELTIHNIVNWVNQRINTDESAGWQELSHKLWRALLP